MQMQEQNQSTPGFVPPDTTQTSRAQAIAFAVSQNTPATQILKEELDKAYSDIVGLRIANTTLQGEVQALTRMIFDKDSQLRALHVGYTNMASTMQNELQYLRAQPAPDPVSPALKEELHIIQ